VIRGSSGPHLRVAFVLALAGTFGSTFGCSADSQSDRCVYPAAAYGYKPGDTLPPTLTWVGTTEAEKTSTVSIADYLDCDGSRGIHAVLIDQSTAWCGACQALATKIGREMRDDWRARGIRVLSLITQAADGTPASAQTALSWKDRFDLDGTAVVADPARSLRGTAGEEAAPYPYEVIVDPRTMTIVRIQAGFSGEGDFASLLELARVNAGDR
jgi:hypothetical protein